MAPLYCHQHTLITHYPHQMAHVLKYGYTIQICKFNHMHEYVNCGYQLLELDDTKNFQFKKGNRDRKVN